jgi:hypothetical protein
MNPENRNTNNNKDKTVYKPSAIFQNEKNVENSKNERKNEHDSEQFHKNQKIEKQGLADFSEEYNGKLAKILVLNQPLLIGKIVEVRPYWIKFENPEGKTIYINKAFIITIEPIGVKP